MEALGRYRGVMQRLVRAYKDEPEPPVAPLVEAMMAAMLRKSLAGEAPVLVPVPMARVRRRQRGFNPPERLAGGLGRRLAVSVRPHAVRRVRFHRPLRGLPAGERRRETAGAFAPGPDLEPIRGRRIWLIDDVLTTGATLVAVRSALVQSGCAVEKAFTLARTPRPGRNRGAGPPRVKECFEKS